MLGKPRTRTVVRTLAASRPSAPIPAAALTPRGFLIQSSYRGVALRTAYVASEVAVPGLGHADLTATYVAATVRSVR